MIRIRTLFTRTGGFGFALMTALALGAGPLLAECENQDGTPRGCTPSEDFYACQAAAKDAKEQCLSGAESVFQRFDCYVARFADGLACTNDLVGEMLG